MKKRITKWISGKTFFAVLAFLALSIGAINAQVCSIGTNTYATLDLALADVPTGGTTPTTIKLLANIDYSSTLTVSNKKITFDLNGKNLNVVKTISGDAALVVDNGGNIFLSGIGNFNVTSTGSDGTYINASGDKATVTNATGSSNGVFARQGAELNVLGNVTATAANGVCAFAYDGGSGGTKITINGTITVPATGTYIKVGTTTKTKNDYEAVTTKVGYFTYTDGSNTVWVKDPSSSAVENVELQNLKLYPNPVKDELVIENGELRIEKVEICDLTGKTIYQFENLKNKINVSALSQGIYIVRLKTDKGTVTEKFIKE